VTLSTYEFTVRCAAPPEVVFEVIVDITRWHEWAGWSVGSSTFEREGEPPPGGVGAVRRMGRWPVFTRERVLEYEPPRHYSYEVVSGFPVRGYHADVDLTPDARGGTTIRWSGAFQPIVPGTGSLMEALVGRGVHDYAKRAAREAERRAKAS
jgi:uncharacterized protein YndB with AHSA1/START domain